MFRWTPEWPFKDPSPEQIQTRWALFQFVAMIIVVLLIVGVLAAGYALGQWLFGSPW